MANQFRPLVDLLQAGDDVEVFSARQPLSTGKIHLGQVERRQEIIREARRVELRKRPIGASADGGHAYTSNGVHAAKANARERVWPAPELSRLRRRTSRKLRILPSCAL